MPERRYVSAAHLAKLTGFTSHWLTTRAAQGKIPGACQPGGPGGAWRFDEEEFWRAWNSSIKREEKWHPSTSAPAVVTGGGESSGKGRITESPLKRRLRELRKSDS
jgi:hypothetical protein